VNRQLRVRHLPYAHRIAAQYAFGASSSAKVCVCPDLNGIDISRCSEDGRPIERHIELKCVGLRLPERAVSVTVWGAYDNETHTFFTYACGSPDFLETRIEIEEAFLRRRLEGAEDNQREGRTQCLSAGQPVTNELIGSNAPTEGANAPDEGTGGGYHERQ